MATTTYPTQTYIIPQHGRNTYIGPHGQPSPASSTSPASPKMSEMNPPYNPNPTKQLRPLKSPLYIPAVLRPTQHFPIMSPTSPPKGSNASLQHVEEVTGQDGQSDLDAYLSEMQIEETEFCEVTGPPKQDHWKPDPASTSCDSPKCRSSFGLFVRKHHCRHCGHIFCSSHSSQNIPLDQEAQFHPNGQLVRACDTCYRHYEKWDTQRSMRRKNSDGSSRSGSDNSTVASFGHHRTTSSAIQAKNGQQQPSAMISGTPKDSYHWSTF